MAAGRAGSAVPPTAHKFSVERLLDLTSYSNSLAPLHVPPVVNAAAICSDIGDVPFAPRLSSHSSTYSLLVQTAAEDSERLASMRASQVLQFVHLLCAASLSQRLAEATAKAAVQSEFESLAAFKSN